MSLLYNQPEFGKQIQQLDWRLRQIVLALMVEEADERMWDVLVTSVHRNDGVHATGRALDGVFISRQPTGDRHIFSRRMEKWVNQKFRGRKLTGGKLPVAYYHKNRKSEAWKKANPGRHPGMHMHLQVPARKLQVIP